MTHFLRLFPFPLFPVPVHPLRPRNQTTPPHPPKRDPIPPFVWSFAVSCGVSRASVPPPRSLFSLAFPFLFSLCFFPPFSSSSIVVVPLVDIFRSPVVSLSCVFSSFSSFFSLTIVILLQKLFIFFLPLPTLALPPRSLISGHFHYILSA